MQEKLKNMLAEALVKANVSASAVGKRIATLKSCDVRQFTSAAGKDLSMVELVWSVDVDDQPNVTTATTAFWFRDDGGLPLKAARTLQDLGMVGSTAFSDLAGATAIVAVVEGDRGLKADVLKVIAKAPHLEAPNAE